MDGDENRLENPAEVDMFFQQNVPNTEKIHGIHQCVS